MKNNYFNITSIKIIGIIFVFISAISLLLYGNATSNQAMNAMTAQVYFDGEYRISDGNWQKIVKGKHISSTKGDVTLRGNFHMLTPDGEYVGIYDGDIPIAFYTNHINLTFNEHESEPFIIDTENSLYGSSACGEDWTAYAVENKKPIEIIIHNPHRFGNETAIDELLENTDLWNGIEFEKSELERGESKRNIGLFFMIVSLMFLGTALFSTLIHIKKGNILWILGFVILFAGTYIAYSSESISFWSNSIVTNTSLLGCSLILYMLFLTFSIVSFLKSTKKLAFIIVALLSIFDTIIFILPIFTNILFYDTWLYWTVLQIVVNLALFACLINEFIVTKGKHRLICFGFILPLIAYCIDATMIGLGLWNSGKASKYVFIVFFIAAMVAVLKIIPNSINALAKTKELETEKITLNAQITESRMSTMMSQIRPHFIYNTLGSIEQLCKLDPQKAGELVHNFAKYLRGNFGELDNPKPILMSHEMDHVTHYINIEKVRFPDMEFLFEMKSSDFYIPALTIQPLVENAIKHGLMKLEKGGTIRVVSYENENDYCVTVEDNGVGFDKNLLLDERKHVGIRNIRERLNAMVSGTLEIESTKGVGTKVTIKIPKEA